MNIYFEMLLSVFLLSIAIRNVWPQKMTIKAYAALCALLRNTRPQNICMGLTGCVLTVIIDNLLIGILALIPDSILNHPYVGFAIIPIQIILFYMITLFCGRLIKKGLLSEKGSGRSPRYGI